MSESLILKIKDGKLVGKSSRKGKPEEVVKELIPDILKEWDPKTSDLSIVRYSLKELLKEDVWSGHIYLISYKGIWEEGSYRDREILVITSKTTSQRLNELLNVLEAYTLSE